MSFDDARDAAKDIGFPVLVRPSYVIGGRAMEIVYDDYELKWIYGRSCKSISRTSNPR